MHNIKIGSRNIGEGRPCFIIAEAGSNHNRKLDLAFQLIDIAKESGADAVKFQSFKADKHYPKIKSNKPGKSSYEITKNKELPEEWIPKLSRYCKERDILFMSSVFYDEAVDILNPYVSVFKIASSEMTHYPLIQYAHGTGKPLIISTGMADLSEVNGLVDMLEGLKMNKPKNYVLLHCTVSYPADFADANLRAIEVMRKRYDVPIGISDHTRDPLVVPVAAVALGANLIEKHFTISNSLPGADHSYALEPDELKNMVKAVRDAELALGSGKKKAAGVEIKLKRYLRRAIFAVKDIAAGQALSAENIDILRSADKKGGLDPKEYFNIIGKKTKRSIKAYAPIRKEFL